MMNRKQLLATLLLVLGTMACKKEGCTDPLATNYDPKAKTDNGTCTVPTPDPRLAYTGTYEVTDSLFFDGNFQSIKTYNLVVSIGTSTGDTLFFNNFWGNGATFYALVFDQNFSFPSQQVDVVYYASGDGTIDGQTISYETSGDIYRNKGIGTQ